MRRLLLMTGLLAAFPALAAADWRPYESLGEAPLGYWFVVVVFVFVLSVFIGWALWAPHPDKDTPSTGRYHALGALVVAMTVFTLMLYVVVAGRIESMGASEDAWDWQPGQVLKDPGGSGMTGEPYRGYEIYLAEGCTYCHTMYIRPQDIPTGWAPGATEDDITEPGDFAHYPYTLLGTQRNGPDLSLAGRQIPDMGYQIEHLQNPRQFKPRSVMPRYDYLSDPDLRDLAAYLVTLGNDPQALRAGKTSAPSPSTAVDGEAGGELSLVDRGQGLYRSRGCVGCHSVDGSRNVGPSLKGLVGHEVALKGGGSVQADAEYLKRAITDPGAEIVQGYPPVMPDNFDDLSDEDLDALIAYFESLDAGGQ